LEWKRASTIYQTLKLFDSPIKSSHILQGELGNCYFISTLSSLADASPGFLESMFVNKEINKAGVYAVRFYLNG